MTPLRLSCFFIACAIVAPACAQTAAPADAAIAKPNCTAPEDFPGSLSSDRQRQQWQREYTAYSDCMKKFINEQKALAEPYLKAYNWLASHHTVRDRIDFYDRRCAETAERVEREFRSAGLAGTGADALWDRVKLHFIGLLIDHRQPECAETFFNTVSCKLLHRSYFHNRFLFVRPAASTEYLDADAPSYRSYYPQRGGIRQALIDVTLDLALERRFADFRGDLRHVLAAMRRRLPRPFIAEANFQIQVLSSLFFRNQSAYAVGRLVNGSARYPFVIAIKHDAGGRLVIDALLTDPMDLALL